MSKNVSSDVGEVLKCLHRWMRKKRQMCRKVAAKPRRRAERSLPFVLAESHGKTELGVASQTTTRYRRPLQTLPTVSSFHLY